MPARSWVWVRPVIGHVVPWSGGFDQVRIGPAYDTFGGASGESNARAFAVYGYDFLGRTGAELRADG